MNNKLKSLPREKNIDEKKTTKDEHKNNKGRHKQRSTYSKAVDGSDDGLAAVEAIGARVKLRCESESRASNIVNAEDVVEAVAASTGMPIAVVKSVLQVKEEEQLELIAKELAIQIPIGGREWVEGLAAWLAGCSAEEAEKLAQTIRAAKAKLASP